VALRDERVRQLERAEAARAAIDDRRLGLEYQSVIDVQSGRPLAVEALLRWPDPMWDDVGAEEIVSIAEAGGRVAELTALVVDTVCADLAAWRAGGEQAPAWVGVNLSPAQVTSPGMVDHLARTLVSHGLRGSDLSFEISEGDWVQADGALDEVLTELIALGAKVVLDDVGASVSSLNSIASAPITGVKLDRTFFFGGSPACSVVVRAAVGVAVELGLDVVVEGIEGDEDLAFARSEGSTMGQGFAFGHPVIAAAVPSIFEPGTGR
jgi:EAL domain-containing protein (putative c-di-GMP-specific phosphodiesterase class I)